MQNDLRSPVLSASQRRVAPPSAKAIQYLKEAKRRERLQNISQIFIIIFGSIAYGFSITVICFASCYLFMTPLGKMLADLIMDIFKGISSAVLPKFLVPYTPWMMFALPALTIGAQFAYALATKTHGFSTHSSSWIKTLINAVGYGLPFVVFPAGLVMGIPLVPLLWTTWGAGILSGFYTMFAYQLVNQIFPDQRVSRRLPPPEVAAPTTQQQTTQRPNNAYLPRYQNGLPPHERQPLNTTQNVQEGRPRNSPGQF